jgi:hypothetical protein
LSKQKNFFILDEFNLKSGATTITSTIISSTTNVASEFNFGQLSNPQTVEKNSTIFTTFSETAFSITSTSTTACDNSTTSASTSTNFASVLNISFSFGQLANTQTVDLLASNYDLSHCLLNCSNNGVCKFDLANNKFVCSCFSAFLSGASCQFDARPCASSPCLNNAACVDFTNAYGYNMSSNFGTNSTEFYCWCDKYHQGSYCETKINICQNETCSGNGNCVDVSNQPKCECFNMYLGEKCDTQSAEMKTVKAIISFTSIIAIITVVLFYALFIIIDLTKFYLKKVPNPKNDEIEQFKNINFDLFG